MLSYPCLKNLFATQLYRLNLQTPYLNLNYSLISKMTTNKYSRHFRNLFKFYEIHSNLYQIIISIILNHFEIQSISPIKYI